MAYKNNQTNHSVRVNQTQSYETKIIDLGFKKTMVATEYRFDGPEWGSLFKAIAEDGHTSHEVACYMGASIDVHKKLVKYGGGFRSSIAFPRHRNALCRFFVCKEDEVRCGVLKRTVKLQSRGDNDTLVFFINGRKADEFFAEYAPAQQWTYAADDDWVEGGD